MISHEEFCRLFDEAQERMPHWGHYQETGGNVSDFEVKDSGQRQQFSTGMQRDVTEGKILWGLVFDGPMLKRWAQHLTAGAKKYNPRNWMKARTDEELDRAKDSAARHFAQWMAGERDEDHGAAVMFNINLAEYIRDQKQDAGYEATLRQTCKDAGLDPEKYVRSSPQSAAKESVQHRTISRGTPLNLPLISEMPAPKGDAPTADAEQARLDRRHPFLGEVRHPRAR